MAGEEGVGRVLSCVHEWHSEGEGVWVIFDAVHESSFAGVDFEDAFAFITGEKCFHHVALSSGDPCGLGECDFSCHIARLKEVPIHVASEGASFNFCNNFYVFRNGQLQMCHF